MYLQLGSVPAVAISSAKIAEMVLKTHDLDFCGRPDLVSSKTFSYNFLDVAFAPYGEGWRQMRKVCTLELFSSKRVQSFRFIREEEVDQLVGNISKSCQWRGVVNLSEMLFSLTNNVTCRGALGKSYQVGDGERSRFHQVLAEGEELSVAFFVADYFPSLGWVDVLTGKQGRLRKVSQDLDGFYEEVIQEHLNPSRSETLEQEDLVDVLIKVQKELGLTRDHIKAVLMNILFGGTDSSSTVMEWTMTELMKNKKVLKKAQEEVRRVAAGKAKVEEYDLNQLHYLKSVIKETLRLHPPAPLLVPHATTRDCNVHGYDIPAKTRVFVNVLAIGRDPESWDSPEDFIPERFSDDSIDYKGSNFELIPFGAGRRGCPGMNLGMVIVELALANLLYAFNWEFPCGSSEEEEAENEAEGLAVHRRSPLLLVPKAHISS
ncbi:cytochrome P450 71A1-like [Aristolochia californica]|uniref:cytochrome P450 71A1-like n=1 Tax=Aristolochia californica TaxID=171875 RepID=UPI0035D8E666